MIYDYAVEVPEELFKILIILLAVGLPGLGMLLKMVQDNVVYKISIEKSYQRCSKFYDLMLSSLGLFFLDFILFLILSNLLISILSDVIVIVVFLAALSVAIYGARFYHEVEE